MAKIRMIDIAQVVGVSKVTVSKVLSQTAGNNTQVNANTVRRILDVARQMGYLPNIAARQLAGQNSRLIGVLIDANSIFNEFPRVVYEEQAASARGYRVIVGQCHPESKDVKGYLDDFTARAVDGLIMHAHAYPDLCRDMIEASKRFQHVVYYDRPLGDVENLNFVDINLSGGMKKLVRHLVAGGRRKIVYFAPYMRFLRGKFRSFQERERGYREAMAECGLPFDQHFDQRYLFPVEPGVNEIVPLVRELVKNERPDAIIARNDEVGAMVLRTLHEMGVKCPADIAVAGSDNRNFAEYLYPGLTSIDSKLALVSNTAVEMMIRMIEGKEINNAERQVTIEPELIVREST